MYYVTLLVLQAALNKEVLEVMRSYLAKSHVKSILWFCLVNHFQLNDLNLFPNSVFIGILLSKTLTKLFYLYFRLSRISYWFRHRCFMAISVNNCRCQSINTFVSSIIKSKNKIKNLTPNFIFISYAIKLISNLS